MRINTHLRELHGYSLSESVQRSPREMLRLHEREHEERDCGHPADEIEGRR